MIFHSSRVNENDRPRDTGVFFFDIDSGKGSRTNLIWIWRNQSDDFFLVLI